jgi:hypothetical protein
LRAVRRRVRCTRMMGRVSEPEMPRAASSTSARIAKTAKTAKTPLSAAFWHHHSIAGRQERVNVNVGGRRSSGAVTHTSREGAFPENEDQPYGTEYERARESATDASVRREAAGRLSVPEAEGPGADPLSAAWRRARQRRTEG